MPEEPKNPTEPVSQDNVNQWGLSPEPTEPTTDLIAPDITGASASTLPSPSSSPAVMPPDNAAVLAFETEPSTQANTELQPQPMDAQQTEQQFGASAPDVATMSAVPSTGPENKKSKGKLILLSSALAAILLFTGVGVAAYNFWYQNPDKVVLDGFIKAITAESATAKGSFGWTSEDADVKLAFDSESGKDNAAASATLVYTPKGTDAVAPIRISGEAVVVKNGDVYFKGTDLEKSFNSAVDSFIDMQAKSSAQSGYAMPKETIAQAKAYVTEQYGPIIKKVDGQWVKVGADKSTAEKDSTQKCLADAVDTLKTDKNAARQLSEVYRKNKFITVKEKLGTKDGSLGYVLTLDEKAAKSFGKAVDSTDFGKALAKCDESPSSTDDSTSDSKDYFKDTRFELWADKWSHEITSIKFDTKVADQSDATFSLDLNTTFNDPVTIDVPKNAKSFEEIEKELSSSSGMTTLPVAI